MKSIKNNPILVLLVTCFAIYFVNLDAFYVNIMEARNFISALRCFKTTIGYYQH